MATRGFRETLGRRGQWASWDPQALRDPRVSRDQRGSGVRARVTRDPQDLRVPRVRQDRRGSLLQCRQGL